MTHISKGTKNHFLGCTAELYIAYLLSERGCVVSYPLFTQSKYDLIADYEGKLYKSQVKKATLSSANGHPFIQVRLGGAGRPKYKEGDFDYLAITYEGAVWVLPYEETKDKTSMSFSIFSGEDSKGGKYLTKFSMEKFLDAITNKQC